jgi:hypothetical protein
LEASSCGASIWPLRHVRSVYRRADAGGDAAILQQPLASLAESLSVPGPLPIRPALPVRAYPHSPHPRLRIPDGYLFASILLLAYLSRARLDYLLMSLFMGAAGLVLANQNYQGPGILTFIPAALVAILAPRSDREAAGEGFNLANILLAGALMVPPAVAGLGNLAFHFFAASTPPGANRRKSGSTGSSRKTRRLRRKHPRLRRSPNRSSNASRLPPVP